MSAGESKAEKRGPLPARTIQAAIAQSTGVGVGVVSPPLLLRVEVETRQGYVYEGKLAALDDEYNVSLTEATSWRERLCDIERALLTAQGMPAPLPSPATRRRYIGSVFIRSSNLFMLRFSHSASGPGNASLAAAFSSSATRVRREIQLERQRNRVARRARLQMVKKPAEKNPQKGATPSEQGGKAGKTYKKRAG